MDLQLYKVDSSNYLVDFRNVGYYRTPAGQPGYSRLAVPTPSHTGVEEQTQEVCSPFLFLDCACRSVHFPACLSLVLILWLGADVLSLSLSWLQPDR